MIVIVFNPGSLASDDPGKIILLTAGRERRYFGAAIDLPPGVFLQEISVFPD